MENLFAGAVLEFVLTSIIASVIFGIIIVPRFRKKNKPADDELGEDVPPMTFSGRIYPKSLPHDFGKGPRHK